MSFLSEAEARAVADKLLAAATAPETVVFVNPPGFFGGGASGGNTRFARNDVTTSGATETVTVQVESLYGKRKGTATGNQLDDASLADVVHRAEEMARLAPEDPEVMPVLPQQKYLPESQFYDDVHAIDPAWRARAVATAIAASKAKGFEAAGLAENFADSEAVATSKGLFAWRRSTGVAFSLTVRSPDGGSGWSGGTGNSLRGFDPAAMTARAVDLAARTGKPVALEPGNYTAILSAECVADLTSTMFRGLFGSGPFNQRTIDEGRSFLSKFGKEMAAGGRIFSEKTSIYSDPGDPDCPGDTFDAEGQPLGRTDWIKEGVVRAVACSRYWAEKTKRAPQPQGSNLIMTGGKASTEELIASTKRGVLVTRFWYVRPVDPQTNLHTGLTRDGCFLIEDGKVTRAVKNFRWNETPVKMLRNIEAMSPSRRVITSEQGLGSSLFFPDLKVTDFTFSSLSDAV